MPAELDRIDLKMLRLLQKNGRLSNAELADQVGGAGGDGARGGIGGDGSATSGGVGGAGGAACSPSGVFFASASASSFALTV